MKLVKKLAIATLTLAGVVPVQFAMAIGERAPGIDIVGKSGEPAGAPVNTTRSNKRAGKAESREANDVLMQVSTTRGTTVKVDDEPIGPAGAPVNTSRSNKRAGKAETREANTAMGDVSTTRGTTVKGDDAPIGPAGAPVSTTRSNKR